MIPIERVVETQNLWILKVYLFQRAIQLESVGREDVMVQNDNLFGPVGIYEGQYWIMNQVCLMELTHLRV